MSKLCLAENKKTNGIRAKIGTNYILFCFASLDRFTNVFFLLLLFVFCCCCLFFTVCRVQIIQWMVDGDILFSFLIFFLVCLIIFVLDLYIAASHKKKFYTRTFNSVMCDMSLFNCFSLVFFLWFVLLAPIIFRWQFYQRHDDWDRGKMRLSKLPNSSAKDYRWQNRCMQAQCIQMQRPSNTEIQYKRH